MMSSQNGLSPHLEDAVASTGTDTERIEVVYIAGVGRSGSTLLEMILGQIDGFVSVGELRYLWRVLSENHKCGCGTPIRGCAFWNQVIEAAFGSWASFDPEEILTLRLSVDRLWRNPQLAFPVLRSAAFRRRLDAYGDVLDSLYRAITTVSGARYVIDSSKQPSHGYLLSTRDLLRVHFIHLIRDSRAVGHSWRRRRLRPEIHWEERYMPVFNPAFMLLTWYIETTFNHYFLSRGRPPLLIRYEDFVTTPRPTITRILDHLGDVPLRPDPFLSASCIRAVDNHTVSGNPFRFRRGAVDIRPDTSWQTEMSPLHRYLLTFATFPFLKKYGYV